MKQSTTSGRRGTDGARLGHTLIIAALLLFSGLRSGAAVTPPVIRSTAYNGAYSNIVYYPLRPWMNTNTVNLTVEAWIRANDLIGNQAFVARNFTTNLYFGLSGNRLRLYRSGGTSVDSSGTVAVRRWTHVAATYDGTTARFYIDGVAAGTAALANRGNDCTNSLSLGGQRDNAILANGYAFNGSLDEVRIWSVARSQAQIAAAMNDQVRSGTGLLATFGSGGWNNDLTADGGVTDGIPILDRHSGFGILPADICVPRTANLLRADANIDLLNEYRGAETIVLRPRTSPTAADRPAYLMVSTNATNFHLFVGVPDLQQGGGTPIPTVQLWGDVNVNDGNAAGLGDWECRLTQDNFVGARIFTTNPPLFPDPTWFAWFQGPLNWEAATASPFEFTQSYEFRIHGRHLNYFTNVVGLLARYYDYDGTGDQLTAPRGGITNQPATYARVNWCGPADSDLSLVSFAGSVTNLSSGAGVAGRHVRLYSGDSELDGFLIAETTTDAQGRFAFNSVNVPNERRLTVTYDPPVDVVLMPPVFDTTFSSRLPVFTNSPSSVRFPACASSCNHARVNFRHRSLGPLLISGVTPDPVPAAVIVRTSPLKLTPTSTITVSGSNFHSGLQLYFRGSGCGIIPPDLCDRDFEEATILSFSADGLSLVAEVPSTLDGVSTGSRPFQLVMRNLVSGPIWNYGPNVTVTPPLWPQLHGFEFVNQDDHPGVEEFEACYDNSIFVYTPVPIRDPFYALWAIVYYAWMEGCRGSCYGMAGTSRLIQEGTLPVSLFDTAASDGVHGVRFGNGLLGTTPCAVGGALCPPWPARWTGFDLFQPFRSQNLWGRVTSMAGAQTSAEALTSWLEQLGPPVRIGLRRGFAAGNPVNVLDRVRSAPGQYTLCVQLRDFGGGHCVTPYAVTDGMGLAADALTPVSAPNSSLIRVYDNNWPGQERFIEVNRVNNIYRYQSGVLAGGVVHEGPGLFSTPMSIYRGSRHAPDPFFMARYGVDFLRLLASGASSMTAADAAGGIAGWTAGGLTNSYEGALPFLPSGLVPGVADRFDTTMFFLPGTNSPAGVGFRNGGSNVMFYAGAGWGDIAFGFHAPGTGGSNSVYGILMPPTDSGPVLQGLGLRAGAPVLGFSAMSSRRDAGRQSRVWLLDAGAGAATPDLHLEQDGFNSLKIRNHSAQPLDYRLNLAGYDLKVGGFEYASDYLNQPGNSTVILKPVLGSNRSFVRELDTNNDGTPDATDTLPARGALRAAKESGLLALRWRPVTANDTLQTAGDIGQPNWSNAVATVTTDGADRLAKVPLSGNAQFYRVLPSASNCLSLAAQPLGAKPNPWTTDGFKFEALNAAGALLAQNTILTRSGATGLDVIHTVNVQPLEDCHVMHLDVRQTSGLVVFEAVGPLGAVMSRQELVGAGTGVQRVTLRGFPNRIQFVRVISPNALCLIVNVCGERLEQPPAGTRLTRCESLSNAPAGQFASPKVFGDLLVSGNPGTLVVTPVSGLGGNWLQLLGAIEVKLNGPLAPCDRVTARVRDLEGGVVIQAFDAGGGLLRTIGPLPPGAAPQTVSIDGPGIASVVFTSNSAKAYVQEVCCDRGGAP